MREALASIRAAARQLAAGEIPVARFAQQWRQQSELLAALPPAFATVMDDTVQRLESVSLFSEESCSFSQADLLANVEVWVRKAEARLLRD